jgi:SpoVK/Ycf46/Vps4 family AAA+-type ATPase
MIKLILKQPGFFITLPSLGSFRSPFEVRIPESLRPLVESELLKNGVKNFKVFKDNVLIEKKQEEKDIEQLEKKAVVNNMSEVLKRLDDIQVLMNKILDRETVIRKVIIQKEEPGLEITKQPEIEEEIFIPSVSEKISVIDLSVKTVEKENIDSQVDLLSNMKK